MIHQPIAHSRRTRSYRTRREGSTCAFSGEHHADGFEQDDDVKEDRMILDVVQIVLELLQRIRDGGAVLMSERRKDSS
jgi:hypothetical protein